MYTKSIIQPVNFMSNMIEREKFYDELTRLVEPRTDMDRGIALYGEMSSIFGIKNIEFTNGREDFNKVSEGGVILISNHPHSLDLSVLLRVLTPANGKLRDDLKIIVSEKTYDFYTSFFDSKFFVKATQEPRKITSIFKEVANFVNNGGMFIMFPTKRDSVIERKPLSFNSGFAHLLTLLNKQDVKTLSVSLSYPNDTQSVKVMSDLRSVDSWQSLINQNSCSQENNDILTIEYQKIHKGNLA